MIDIEREVELGDPTHAKGVLILSGFISGRYARRRPLSLSASLVFEQSYSYVAGDSASAAELCGLLSAIAEMPLRQAVAVTGSVDQHGRLQAIGGVNEKIEGFFETCRRRELTGEQGVVIPAANTRHLMLRDDVLEAVRKERFPIWPATTIDQVMELLTGREAGKADDSGAYPAQSINGEVAAKLNELADLRRQHAEARRFDGEDNA